MSPSESVMRQTTLLSVLLIASGLSAVIARRHPTIRLLGFYLSIAGVALLMCRRPSPQAAFNATVMLGVSPLAAPIVLRALARNNRFRTSNSIGNSMPRKRRND
jgi:hypothetical protein